MSLTLSAKGEYESVDIGYRQFSIIRLYIAEAYSEKHGKLYKYFIENMGNVFDNFFVAWNNGNDKDLDKLLFHSDCSGQLTYTECKKLYSKIQNLDVKIKNKDMNKVYNNFVDILKCCVDAKTKMLFT